MHEMVHTPSLFFLFSRSLRQSNSRAVADTLNRIHVIIHVIIHVQLTSELTKDPFGLCRAGCFWLSQWDDCVLVYEARLTTEPTVFDPQKTALKPLRDEPKDSTVTWLLLVVHLIL